MPRPAPDLDARRRAVLDQARTLAEAEGWTAVTVRRLAGDLGLTLPLLYTVFDSRQAVLDAVALEGFAELTEVLGRHAGDDARAVPAYLRWARRHPATYEAMFVRPTELAFASRTTPPQLTAAFAAVQTALGLADGHAAETGWALLHGLAVLERDGRVPARGRAAREAHALAMVRAVR